MLVDTYAEILIKSKAAQTYYKNKYNILSEIGKNISVPISELNLSCHVKVKVKCIVCDKEKMLDYAKYNSNIKNYGFYSCKKCANIKRKKTMQKIYNVDNPSQIVENRIERSEWMKSKEFKLKSKNSLIDKYGVDSFSKTNEFKFMAIIKHNNKSAEEKQQILEKIKQTVIHKYGVEYYVFSDEYKEKTKNTNLQKYGEEIYANTDDFKLKAKTSLLANLGVDNAFKSDKIKAKILSTKILLGLIHDYTKLDTLKYNLYCRKIDSLTRKNKKKIFENWDGLDHYDNNYIKENLAFHYTHKFYPTIDHKISKFEGFLNKISVDDMVNIDNLCITTRSNNSKKSKMSYIDYLNKITNI